MSNVYRKIIKEEFIIDDSKVGDVVRVRENIFINPGNRPRPPDFYPILTIHIYNLGSRMRFKTHTHII